MVIDNSAQEAPREGLASTMIRTGGCRRITLEMRAWLDRADRFEGLPRGTAKPLTFLYAFKEAEPYLGLPAHTYKLIDWLVRLTKPQDWEEGSRPIAWPAARRQEEFLGLSPRRVQALNRALAEAGIFVMRDDPQGRRYGHRDEKTGRLTKAFGFDLSLLAERHGEFKKIAADAQIERNRMKKLRQRKTLARKAIAQAAEELGVQGHDSEALQLLLREAADLVKAGNQCRCSDELALAVTALERRCDEIQQKLRKLIKPVEKTPMGVENDTHNTTTTLNDNNVNHTVMASGRCSRVEALSVPQPPFPSKPQSLFPESLQITPATLVELAPRLASYMPARFSDMTWPTIIEAALFLSGEMGINHTLWGRACAVMGREYAAVAVAIVSIRPQEHFTSGPGGYFAGMLRKFEKNPADLCLGRTLWKLKNERWGKDGHKERRKDEQRCRIEARTKKPMHSGPASAPPIIAAPAPRNSADDFVQVGSVLRQPPTLPMPPAQPRSNLVLPDTSRDWKPSPELIATEQRIKAMFSKPKND